MTKQKPKIQFKKNYLNEVMTLATFGVENVRASDSALPLQ